MRTIKTKSSGQQLRQLAGAIAEISRPYTPEEEFLELLSYRDYLYEEYDPGRALRRAKLRRKKEEQEEKKQREAYPANGYINMTPNALPETTPRKGSGVKLDPLSKEQIQDEILLQQSEKKDYMPDDVFKDIINKLNEPDILPLEARAPSLKIADKLGDNIFSWLYKPSGYILQWFIDTVLGAINSYRIGGQTEEKKNSIKEFYNYSEKALKDAFNRYKESLGITDKDIQQDGKKVINAGNKQKDSAEKIFDQLTSPLAKAEDQYNRLADILYDPRRNPDTRFGSRGYWSDMSTQFLLNMNDAQIGDFLGRIDRSGEIENRGKAAIKYYENVDRIREIDSQIDSFYSQPVSYINSAEGLSLIKQFNTEKNSLLEENIKLEPIKDSFEKYVPSGYGDRFMLGATKILSDLENKVFGTRLYDWTSPIFDDVDVLRLNLDGFNSFDDTNTKRNILQRYIDARKRKIEAWQKGIKMNEDDKQRHSDDHKISDYYKYWEQLASGNIFSRDTWGFKQPGLMGYSMSSWIKQAPMYIGALIATRGGSALRTALAAVGMAGGHSSALSENYMELRENYIPRVKLYLKDAGEDVYDKFIFGGYKTLSEEQGGLSDEEAEKLIINNYLDGIYNPTENVQKIYEATAKAAYGLNALFDRDMVAVDMDNLVNTMILFNPFGKLAKGAKFTTQQQNAVRSLTGNMMESLANPVSVTMAPVTILARKAIDDATTFLATIPGKIYNKAKSIAPLAIKTNKSRRFVSKLELVMRDPAKFATTKVSLQNLKKLAYGITESGISEGIEEGKQWLHGHEFLKGNLDDASVTFGIGMPDWGKWYDDMTAGLHSAYVIAGFPFNIESTHDPELVENIKGGIMGGLFQTGATKIIQTALQTPALVKLNKYMLNNVYAEKAARTDLYEKAKLYAAKSMSKDDTAYILDRFDKLAKAHEEARRRGDQWALPEGLIEEQRQMFLSVAQMANSTEVRNRLDRLGIEIGSEKYAQFIGQLALQQDLLNSSQNNKRLLYLDFYRKIEETPPVYFVDESGKVMTRSGNIVLPYTGMPIPNASAEEMVNLLNQRHGRDTQTALALKVFQDLLYQLEVSDNNDLFGNSRWSKDFMKDRLKKYINSRLSFVPKNEQQFLLQNLDSVIKTLPNHEEFYDIYRKLALASIDNDYAQMMYQGLMGKMANYSEELQSIDPTNPDYLYDDPDYTTTFDRITKAFENRVSGDNALYDALESDYIERLNEIEQKRETARRAAFMAEHPEFLMKERAVNNTKKQPQSHITATSKKTKLQASVEELSPIAKKIKDKKTTRVKLLKDLFKRAGIKIDKKYENVAYNAAKQLARGEITERQFINLFVPREQRNSWADLQETPTTTTLAETPAEPTAAPAAVPTTLLVTEPQLLPVQPSASTPVAPVPVAPEQSSTTTALPIVPNLTVSEIPEPQIPTPKKPTVLPTTEPTAAPKPKTVQTPPPSIPISPTIKNTYVGELDQEEAQKLIQRFKELMNSNSDNFGDDEIFQIVVKLAFLTLKHGNRQFIEFGKAILSQLGEASRPFLKSAYEGARYYPGSEQYRGDMTPSSIIETIDEKTFDKDDDIIRQLEKEVLNISLLFLNVSQELLKYEGYEDVLPSASLLIPMQEQVKSAFSKVKEYLEKRNVELSFRAVQDIKVLLQNFLKIIQALRVEYSEFEQRQAVGQLGKVVQQTTQQQYETWARTALQALTFYSTKLANNQLLTQDDIDNLTKWIAAILPQISTLETMAAQNNIYELLLTNYEYWIGMGINGSTLTLPNVINIEEATLISSWRIFNTMHTRSLDESVAEDDNNIRLVQFTSDENFTEEADFEFKLGGTNSFDGPVQEGFPEKIYVVVTYKGHTFTPVAIWDTNELQASEEDKEFGELVRSLIKNNPGKKIKPVVVSRTKGKTYTLPDGEMVLLTEAGLVDDVYAISFDNDQDLFMLTRAVPVSGGKVLIRATKPNKTGRGVADVYTYSQNSSVLTAGNVVYMKRIKGSNKPLLPINVYSDTMSEGDAQLIVDILTGKYTEGIIGKQAIDMPFILNGEFLGINGPTQTLGLTCRDVLNLILPYGPFGRKGTDIVHIWHSKSGDSKIILSGKFKGDETFLNRVFDLSTVQEKERFKKFLVENVRKNISERVMKISLGKPGEQKDDPLLGLANFVFSRHGTQLRKRLLNGEEIRLGDSSIVFDWDDLSNDKRQGGITGLGWYVKRGFLKTNYAGITGALINFTGAQVENNETPVVRVADLGEIANKPVVVEESPENMPRPRAGRIRRSLEKRSTEESEETRTVEEVRRVLSEIIPAAEEELSVSVSEYYLDDKDVINVCSVSAAAPHVVGRCYSDAIELYKHAQFGVIYHEAFHRICEIFLDDSERARVYKRYENIYRLTHFGKKPTIELIREGVADQFMMFMEQRKTNMGLLSQNIFKRLYNIARLFFKIGSFGQYRLYSQVANGRFKNFKLDDAAKKRAEKFALDHPEGYGFEISGVNFKYILNDHEFRDLINSLVYFTFDAYWDETNKVNTINFDGSNISDLKVDKETILKSASYLYYVGEDTRGSKVLLEAMEHFEVFAPYIVSAISEFATDYKAVREELNAEEALDEDTSAASISEHVHQSYEFSQFSRTSSRVRFFFSRIDDTIVVEDNGTSVNADKPNSIGLPLFLPSKEIFNDVLNQLWDVEDLNELMNRLSVLAQDSPVYEQLYNRLNGVVNRAYKNGYNTDEESLLVQIFNIIKSNKLSFLLAKASRFYQGGNQLGYTVTIENTDQEYNARQYRFDWSNLFAHGGSIFVEVGEDGKIIPKKGMRANSMARYWGLITNVDSSEKLGLAAAFSSDEQLRKRFTMTVEVDGKRVVRAINAKDNKQDLDLCKIKFILLLNCFGIQFDKANLDYMLRKKYGNSGFDGMQQMFQETGVASLNAVTFWMNGTYYEKDGLMYLNLDEDGRINGRRPERVFAYSPNRTERGDQDSNGFFGELAKYKYQYRHAHDQLSVLATGGNKFYVISENNYITDTTHFLNRALQFYQKNDDRISSEIEEFDELCLFSYNLIEEEGLFRIGSVILKRILDGVLKSPLEVCTLSGMKSDYSGDTGVDYATMSRRDDYIAKLLILLGGGIIFPTMSDKKTWTFIKGIVLPGINWSLSITGKDLLKFVAHDVVTGKSVVDNRGRISTDALFSYALQNKDEVVDQLIEYFITEHAAVALTIADMKTLPENRKVDNYHGGQEVVDGSGKTHIVIQGARHSSLLNLYDDNDLLIPISRVLDENGNYIDEETEWNNVDDLFFAMREGETEEDLIKRQRIYVNRILKHRLEEELAKLEQIGLVKKIGTGNTIFDYENIGIDVLKVNKVYEALLSNYNLREGTRITAGPNGETLTVQDLTETDVLRFKSLALATVINDGMVKAIMSKNETERIFSGHPSFFKWKYNSNGELIDRGVDQHKRYGGLVSTGQNPALWARGVNRKYRSAELNEEDVCSSQIEFLRTVLYDNTFRKALIDYILDKEKYSVDDDLAKEEVARIDKLTLSEVKEELAKIQEEENSDILTILENSAKKSIEDFEKVEDIANGSAYVTDTFFELMLRSIGSWNSDIERAFKILRGEEVDGKIYTINDINTIAEATKLVHTAVIGSQKYTAYGQRKQSGWDDKNGFHHEGETMIPYYDKFALFPLFKVICTGKMANLYKAMQNQNVDMLKIKSAVKTGSEGSQPLDWSEWTNEDGSVGNEFSDPKYGFKFNVYEQRMKYLRKLFNTDPKEKEFLTMGTQMTKVVMQALTPGRIYTTLDGRTMTARELRDDVMSAMNEIAKLGDEKFRKEFFNKDGSVNLLAFVRMIKDELSRRGASRDVMDGFTIIKRNGKEELKISPAAQSDINWIQSILASVVNKRTIDINTPGNLFIQRSVWNMEGPTRLLGDTNLPTSINNGEKLKMINEEGSMDCVLSIDYFEHIIPKGLSFSEAKQWLIDNEIISGVKTGETTWNNAKANIVGYRIPTQAVSSIHAFRCVDVLPVLRDTIIMPEEFVRITGSDFDIDKMFLSMLNYRVDKRKNSGFEDIAGKFTYIARDWDFLSSEPEYHQNRLIKDYIAMLLNKGEDGIPRNVLQLHGSIDSDTKLLTNTLKELEQKGAFKERLTYEDYTLSNEIFIKQDYITGKNGIGPFALNNNNHVLTMLYGVRFKSGKNILTRLGLTRLDGTVDRDGKSIFSWLSGLINAHVDIAKDPYISRLGVNPFTYNMTNLLIRTGLGKYTFYFLTQPLIMQLAEAYTNAGGVYGVDRTKTISLLRKESRLRFIINYINANMGTLFSEYDYKEAMEEWKKRMKIFNIHIDSAISYLFDKKTSLMRDISALYKASGDKVGSSDINKTVAVIDGKYGHSILTMFDMQMILFSAFELFEPYANALANVVKYSKIDTKKQGKNITEQRAYLKGVYNTFENIKGTRRFFNGNLYKMYKNSYILQKTNIALDAFNDLVSSSMILATPQFERQLNMLAVILNKDGEMFTELFIEDASNAIMLQIKSRFINLYASRHNIDVRGLVSGDNTIYDRLIDLTIKIKTDKKYANLISDGEITNYLLRSLVTSVNLNIDQDVIISSGNQQDTYKNAKFVKLLNFLEEDLMDSDELRSAWAELLYDGNYPELLEFARDLIVYAFITNGDVGGGMRNLFKFVPNSWKLDTEGQNESYNDYMIRVRSEYLKNSAPAIDIEDIILNNWRNYSFVPTYSISRKGGFRFLTYFANNADYPVILAGITTANEEMYPTFNENPGDESYYPSPLYLKIKRSNEDINEYSQRSWNVYKRMAYGQYVDENGTLQVYPIYVLVQPKGNVFEGGNLILEYGRLDLEYTEVLNAITKDPVISALLMGTGLNYTDVESLLDLLASVANATDVLTAYNNLAKTNLEFDETLKFILQGYSYRQKMLNAGGTVTRLYYNRDSVEQDVENLYIFTDNTDRDSGTTPVDENSWYFKEYSTGKPLHYPNTTTALIRGLNNAYPISTQKYYHEGASGQTGRWNDSDYDLFVETIERELGMILDAWFSGLYKNIIMPAGVDGLLGGHISLITEERTPKLYEYASKIEDRIRAMVEQSIPMVQDESSTFKPGEHPWRTLLDLAFNNTVDLLRNVANNTQNEHYRTFVQQLIEYAKDRSVSISYVHAGNNKESDGYFNAHYMSGVNKIEVNLDSPYVLNEQYQEEILLHETLHSLTSIWLNEHPDEADAIMEIAEYAKSKMIEQGLDDLLPMRLETYFKNAKEFITYASTDMQFRDVLSKIDAIDSDKYNNLLALIFGKIKEILYKIANISDNKNLIKQIDPIVSGVLDMQLKINEPESNIERDDISLSDFTAEVNLGKYNNSKDILSDILRDFNSDIKNTLIFEKVTGSTKGGYVFKLYKGSWWVNHKNSKFSLNGNPVSAIEHAEYYLKLWLADKKLPTNLLYINKRGIVLIDRYYTTPVYTSFYDTDDYSTTFKEELRQFGSDLMRKCGY